jgi:HSP90 family molecular chaperone
MTAQIHETKVSMDGLLEVLGKNLYSAPAVAIRELVQNAHDACIRRKLEQFAQQSTNSPTKNQPDLRITLSVDAKYHILYIEDTGSGPTSCPTKSTCGPVHIKRLIWLGTFRAEAANSFQFNNVMTINRAKSALL